MGRINKVKEFIVENFLFGDENGFNEDTSFLQENLIDSMGIMELITFLEETFNIRIKDAELVPQNLDSLNKIANFLEMKLNYVSE